MPIPDFDENKMEKAINLLEARLGNIWMRKGLQAANLMPKLNYTTG